MSTVGEWPSERRRLPRHLRAKAAAHPGGSVAEIDGSKIPDPDGYVPAEAIMGVFPVDARGKATGVFLRNPGYGPVRDDFTRLTDSGHWLGWLPGDPADALREALLETLQQQIPGTVLEWTKVTEDPVFLTGGIPDGDDPERVTVVRAGLAASFVLSAVSPGRARTFVHGVFSWVAVGLNVPGGRCDRTWFDLGESLADIGDALQERIYLDRTRSD